MSVDRRGYSRGKPVDTSKLKNPLRHFWHLVWLIILLSLAFLMHGPLHFRRVWQRLWNEYLAYSIEDRIITPATTLFFTRSKSLDEHIWLKVWQRRKYGNQHIEEEQRDIDNLLDGWNFNRRFAPGVYLGVAPIKGLREDAQLIQRGRLMFMPTKSSLKPDTEYVLVMRHLDENQRLDKQLVKDSFCSLEESMEFLAREVAHMHQRLKKSPRDMGTYKCISAKKSLNADLFERALDQLASMNEDKDIDKYRSIIHLLNKACSEYEPLFNERYNADHIRRCHGDLKTTNLWVRSKKTLWRLKKPGQRLLLLDCVDFRADFCHIDTLSDVAMLAVDIEARLLHEHRDGDPSSALSKPLLVAYLHEVRENSEIAWPLLEYYMLEKAIVCVYVSILFDNLPELSRKYLKVALHHANRLKDLLELPKNASAPEKGTDETVASYSS